MSEYELTVADQVWLAEVGVADAPLVRVDASWPVARVLQAAVAGVLTGPNLDTATDWKQLQRLVRIGARGASGVEVRTAADLSRSGHLAWVGCRITATTTGRELLAAWTQRQLSPRREDGKSERDRRRESGEVA